jgi:hypothetical protein
MRFQPLFTALLAGSFLTTGTIAAPLASGLNVRSADPSLSSECRKVVQACQKIGKGVSDALKPICKSCFG